MESEMIFFYNLLNTDCPRDSSTKRCRFEWSLYVALYIKVPQNPYKSSGDETGYRHENTISSLWTHFMNLCKNS